MELDWYMSRRSLLRAIAGGAAALGVLPLLAACGDDEDEESAGAEADPEADPAADPEAGEGTEQSFSGESLVIYSGRSEELVSEIIERFEQANNLSVEVRYGDTAELAAQLLEEGDGSPADVYFAQDAGALGAVAKEGLFTELPENILERVDERFRSPDGAWVGVSGRARAVVYNTEAVSEADIPASILDFTDPVWKDRLGWAPTNGSFQAFVTALRVERGDDAARDWLEGIIANNPTVFEGNNPIVTAVNEGEIDAGFVNHYYLLRQEA
ncbi:MAG: extracellular solute-binding protein, partial [Planctomycetaceae bacterium]